MITFFGKSVIDNVHYQEDELDYAELLEEDTRYLVTCTETEIT